MATNPNYKQVFKIQETDESTWGTAETDNFLKFAITGFDDGTESVITEDTQINNDGMDTDIRKQTEAAMITLDFDMRYCTCVDWLMQSALRNDDGWTDVSISADDIAFSDADNALSSTSTNFLSNDFTIGMVLLTSGASETANAGLAKVTAVTAKKATLSWLTLSDEAEGETISIKSSWIRNGNDIVSRTCEREFTGLTEFFAYNGMTVDQFEINIESGADVKGRAVLKGQKRTGSGATVGTGAETAESSNPVFKSNLAVQTFRIDNTAVTIGDRRFRLMINNALIPNYELGSVNPSSLTLNVFKASAEVQVYLEDSTLFDAWEALTAQEIDIVLKGTDDNYYAITLFRAIAGAEPKIDAGSREGSSLVSVTLNGVKKASAPAYVCQFCKFAA